MKADPDTTLFSRWARTDDRPAGHTESHYAFLDRVAGPAWDAIREELEAWYRAFPDCTVDLRARFRQHAPAKHEGAWWELYLHRLFTWLGYDIVTHPELPGRSARPDFLMNRGAERFYVEASNVISGVEQEPARHAARERELLAAIDSIHCPDWGISIEIETAGPHSARQSWFVGEITRWLRSLDQSTSRGQDPPERRWCDRGWSITLLAYRREPPASPRERLIGLGPMEGGVVNDEPKIRSALNRKVKRYGKPELPLLLALRATSTFFDDDTMAKVLYGSTAVRYRLGKPGSARWSREDNGLFSDPAGVSRNCQVSAVLVARRLNYLSAHHERPCLWHNAGAEVPLTARLPFPEAVTAGFETVRRGPRSAFRGRWLGVPTAWPPGPLFPRS